MPLRYLFICLLDTVRPMPFTAFVYIQKYIYKGGTPSSQSRPVSKVGFACLFLDFFHFAPGYMTTNIAPKDNLAYTKALIL